MKKKWAIVVLLCCSILSITGCNTAKKDSANKTIINYKMDYPFYKSVKQLIGESDAVIEGKIIEIGNEIIDTSAEKMAKGVADTGAEKKQDLNSYTVYTIQVGKCYRGMKAKEIKLQHIGGNLDGTLRKSSEDAINLIKGKSYLLVLDKIDKNGYYQLLNVDQCIYPSEGTGNSNFSKLEIISGCQLLSK